MIIEGFQAILNMNFLKIKSMTLKKNINIDITLILFSIRAISYITSNSQNLIQ